MYNIPAQMTSTKELNALKQCRTSNQNRGHQRVLGIYKIQYAICNNIQFAMICKKYITLEIQTPAGSVFLKGDRELPTYG